MRNLALSLAALLLNASVAQAELIGRVELVSSGLTDLLTGEPFDVYHVIVDNDLAPSNSIQFSFPGMFFTGVGTVLQNDTSLVAGSIADTFIVLSTTPTVSPVIIDSGVLLEGSYGVPTPLGPAVALGSNPVAVLSVPNEHLPEVEDFRVELLIGGQFLPVRFVPEPSAAALAACGILARLLAPSSSLT